MIGTFTVYSPRITYRHPGAVDYVMRTADRPPVPGVPRSLASYPLPAVPATRKV